MAIVRNIKHNSGSNIVVVVNYSALPNPTTVIGKFYWCENSQGTSWLPGSIGGTFYNSGMYYSNGVSWSFVNVPYQATQSEVNAETVNDKFVTPNTLGSWWSNKKTLAQTLSGIWTWSNGSVFSPLNNPNYAKGLVFYDNSTNSLAYYDDISGTTNNINYEQTLRARNNSGSTILNGTVVYINGALGQNPTIALGKADSLSTCQVIGMATHDIANNTVGKITTFGLVNDLDTSAFSDGALLYLSASTSGAVVSTVPSSPNFNIVVGVVAYSHNTQGKIFIHPTSPIALNTSLGTSNLVSPSQNAVKFYTDTKVTANSAITGATKTKVTYDSKGLVTNGTDATTDDIVESGTPTNKWFTENRVLATLLTGLTTISSTIGASDSILVAFGKIKYFIDNASTTFRAYLDSFSTVLTSLPDTITLSQANSWVRVNVSADGNLTVPPNSSVAIPIGSYYYIRQSGVGRVTLVAGSGVTLNSPDGVLTTGTQYSVIKITKQATDSWIVEVGSASYFKAIIKPLIDTKSDKKSFMRLTSAYTLSNTTALQKIFNVGANSNGAFLASANKAYRFRAEVNITNMSATSGTFSFGTLGTATISNLMFESLSAKATSLGGVKTLQTASATASSGLVLVSAGGGQTGQMIIMATFSVTGSGSFIPAIALSVGATAQIEVNSYCEFEELGADTITYSSNID